MKYRRQPTPQHLEVARDMHHAFCRMETPRGTVPSRAIIDIRRHRQRPWVCLMRRADEAIEAGVRVDAILVPLTILEYYITERCAKRDARQPREAA